MEIYEILRHEMLKKGTTQTWVVKEVNMLDKTLGMTNAKMSLILAGKRKIAGDEFIAICRVLNLDTNVFMQGKESKIFANEKVS